jgi:hypothetical protein
MSTELIGKENLPNIYFNSIDIYPLYRNADSIKKMGILLKLEMKLYDMVTKFGNSYVLEGGRSKQKSIFILTSTDERYTAELAKAKGLITDYKKIKFYSKDSVQVVERRISLAQLEKLNTEKVTPLYYKSRFYFSKEVSHLAVFVCLTRENITGKIDSGPVFSELVLRNGESNKKGFYFVNKITDAIWRGPVHRHKGKSYMAGSFHFDIPHPVLNKIETISTKIKDHRIVLNQQDIIQTQKKSPKKNNNYIFGLLQKSQSLKGRLNYIFDINVAEIVMSQINTNKYSVNESFLYEIAKTSKIENLKIYFNTSNNKNYKLVCNTKGVDGLLKSCYMYEDSDGKYLSSSKNETNKSLYSIVEEKILSEESELRTFSCQLDEKEIKNIKIEISVSNEVESYFKKIVERLKLSLKNLKNYEILLRRGAHYDVSTNKTKQLFIEKYYQRKELWFQPIIDLQKILSLNSRNSSKQIQKNLENMFFMVNPKTTNKDACQKVISFYTKELSRFIKENNSKNSSSFARVKKNLDSNTVKNQFKVTKVYNINYKIQKACFNMLPSIILQDTLPMLRISDVRNILQTESNRLTINQDIVSYSSNEPPVDIEKFFITPRSIVFKNKLYDLSDYSKITDEYLENLLESFTYDPDFSTLFDGLYYEKYVEKIETITSPVSQLGEQSPFQNNLDTKVFSLSKIRNIKNSIVKKSKNIKMKKVLFDNQDNKNILSKHGRDLGSYLPIHLRDLVRRNKVFNVDKNIFLENEQHKGDLMYSNIHKINILTSPKTDSFGKLSLTNRQIKSIRTIDLDRLTEPTLCFITKYENEHFKDEDNKFKKFKAINNVFVLLPDGWNFNKQRAELRQNVDNLNSLYNEVGKYINFDECDIRTHTVEQNIKRADKFKLEPKQNNNSNTQDNRNNLPRSRNTRGGRYARS